MGTAQWKETFEERKVTYTLEVGDRIIVVENVPRESTWRRASSFSHRTRLNASNAWQGMKENQAA